MTAKKAQVEEYRRWNISLEAEVERLKRTIEKLEGEINDLRAAKGGAQ